MMEQLGVLPGTPCGAEVKLGGVDCYVTAPKTTSCDTTKALVYVPDQFGWRFGPQRVVADHLAEQLGVTVLLVDVHAGDCVDTRPFNYMSATPPSWMSVDVHKALVEGYRTAAALWITPRMLVWGFHHLADVETTLQPLRSVMRAARQPQAAGGLGFQKIAVMGAAGLPARAAFALGGADAGACADACVIVQPGKLSDSERGEVAKLRVPSLWIIQSPADPAMNAAQRVDVESILEQRSAARRAYTCYAEVPETYLLVADTREEMQRYKPDVAAKCALTRDSTKAALAEVIGFLRERFLPDAVVSDTSATIVQQGDASNVATKSE